MKKIRKMEINVEALLMMPSRDGVFLFSYINIRSHIRHQSLEVKSSMMEKTVVNL